MELGNAFFGCSRGEFPIKRGHGWEKVITHLFRSLSCDETYGTNFDNETFSLFTYYWGDCTCGMEEKGKPHKKDCLLLKPNFRHHGTGFEIKWYKYPLRDSYKNQPLGLRDFKKITKECIDSLKNQNEKS